MAGGILFENQGCGGRGRSALVWLNGFGVLFGFLFGRVIVFILDVHIGFWRRSFVSLIPFVSIIWFPL